VDTFYDGKIFKFFEAKRLPNKSVHGTGCALASAIAAELAKGISLITAIQRAKSFITGAIAHSAKIGHGSHVINHFLDLYREGEKFKMLGEMETALEILKKRELGSFIPEVQSNLGYALENPKSKEDIMAFPDRIIKKGNKVIAVSGPRFGCSDHISSIILAAMSHDPTKRAAMNIKYLPEIINVCKKIKLSIASFSRDVEPTSLKAKEGSSLDWGVKQAIKKFGSVPDIIYDTGGMGKEPMIRVLANNPSNVADIILKIKQNISKRL
jgi:hydroxymethylpyrimidine/phosphomethylpyrimidine kinase